LHKRADLKRKSANPRTSGVQKKREGEETTTFAGHDLGLPGQENEKTLAKDEPLGEQKTTTHQASQIAS